MKTNPFLLSLLLICFLFTDCNNKDNNIFPIRVVTDLNIDENCTIRLSNGEQVNIRVLEVKDTRDSLREAIRSSKVKILIDGEEVNISSGNYNLPVTIGKVQIDCPITKGLYSNSSKDRWGLKKDVRLRLWPAGSPYITPETFVYPLKQDWMASASQMGNEPTYIDGGESVFNKQIYYHSGLDFGGAEGMDEIVSATDGIVVFALDSTLNGYDDFPGDRRPDVIYIVDNRGWFYRYSHVDSVISGIEAGVKVKMGQKIALMGKEGASGGWVHLHFEIKYKSSEGEWCTEEAYPYVWEAFVKQYKPSVIAIARPHFFIKTDEKIILDGTKSVALENEISSYEWYLSNGDTIQSAKLEISYNTPGEYSEILKVTDSKGNIDYDFTLVYVAGKEDPQKIIPSVHAAYYPTMGIKSRDTVTFLVRTFKTDFGNEVWDFGDGTPRETVKSEMDTADVRKGKYTNTKHSFEKPGDYIVSVERINEDGIKAIAKLHVKVE